DPQACIPRPGSALIAGDDKTGHAQRSGAAKMLGILMRQHDEYLARIERMAPQRSTGSKGGSGAARVETAPCTRPAAKRIAATFMALADMKAGMPRLTSDQIRHHTRNERASVD